MEDSPLQLISGCTKQVPKYQKLLYEEYYDILMKVAFRYVSTYEQALQATHNGFLKIFHEFTRFRINQNANVKETLSVWINRTFIVTLVHHIKSELRLHVPRPIPEHLWRQYDNRPLSDMEIRHTELIKILKGLPTSYRLVFNLYAIDGFSHYEIAKMLGITVEDSQHNLIKAREYCNRFLARYKNI